MKKLALTILVSFFFTLQVTAQVVELSDTFVIYKPCICWQTDSFFVEVECDSIKSYLEKAKGWGDIKTNFIIKTNAYTHQSTKNYYFLASTLNEKHLLETMTTQLYWDNKIQILKKNSCEIEKQIILKKYSDTGTSGHNIYIRNNFIFKAIEIVY
jgi:hypothetical protein